MKKIIPSVCLMLIFGVFCFGQKQETEPDSIENSEGKSVNLTSAANVEAQLEKNLDVKKSEIGDQVVLRVTKTIKQNGEVVVPKGARLIGRITEVQEKTKNNAASRIGVLFERLEGKNFSAPVTATIITIAEAKSAANVAGVFDSDISGSASSQKSVSGGGSGSGLLGGVTNTVGGLVSTTTQTVGNVTNSVGQTTEGAVGTIGRSLAGIQVSQSANASANGAATLSSSNRNLRLEKGTTFFLQINNSLEN